MKTLHRPALQAGLTLVELMVSMAIGLIVTLAITSIVVVGENHKRATVALNDTNQTGNYAAYLLDRALRSAGSGFTQAWDRGGVFGCRLNIMRGTQRLVPAQADFPAPFANVTRQLRVAPVLISRGPNSDVLITMGGNAAAGDVARPILSAGAGQNELRLSNTIGLNVGDIGLVSRSRDDDCLIEQVSKAEQTAGNEILGLGGTYLAGSGSLDSLATLVGSGDAFYSPLGHVDAGNVQLQMFGVDTNRQLVRYDLMQPAADALQPVADGVVALRAMYAIDDNGDGQFNPGAGGDLWAAPDATGYSINSMVDPAKLRKVLAVRIALVLRTDYFEKPAANGQAPSPASLTLFPNLGLATPLTYTVADEDRQFRHRVVELTVPLRNMLLLPTL